MPTLACYNCRYIAAIDGAVSKQNLITISEGTIIDGVHCTPDSVELLPRQADISKSRLRIVVLYSIHIIVFQSLLSQLTCSFFFDLIAHDVIIVSTYKFLLCNLNIVGIYYLGSVLYNC